MYLLFPRSSGVRPGSSQSTTLPQRFNRDHVWITGGSSSGQTVFTMSEPRPYLDILHTNGLTSSTMAGEVNHPTDPSNKHSTQPKTT